MAKQILAGGKEQSLNEVAHYLMIYIPFDEDMCSYTDAWLGELYKNSYPLVSKGMWTGGNKSEDSQTFELEAGIRKPILPSKGV